MKGQPTLFEPVPDSVSLPSSQAPRRGERNPVAEEKVRLNGMKARVLAYLKAHGAATNVELSTEEIGGLGAVRRVWDLQQDGWDIQKTHVKKGVWRYTLNGIRSL